MCRNARVSRDFVRVIPSVCHCFTALSQTYDSDDYLFPISANFLIASPDSVSHPLALAGLQKQ